jgi:hypothetical protein
VSIERLRTRALSATARLATRRPWTVLAVAFALAAAALAYTATSLELRADRNSLIRPGRAWNQRFEDYRAHFGGTRDLVIVLSGGTPGARRAYADDLARRLETDAQVESVFHRVDPGAFAGRRLLLSPVEQLDALAETLEEEGDALRRLTSQPGIEPVLRWVDRRVSEAMVRNLVSGLFGEADSPPPEAADDDEEPLDLEFLIVLLEGLKARLDGAEPASFASPWASFGGGADQGYLTADGGALHLVVVTPASGEGYRGDGRTIDALHATFDAMRARHPEVDAGVTGQRAINVAEMRASVRDTRRAGLLALLGVALVFIAGFGRVAHPLYAVFALLIGIAWSAGATTLLVGHLTVLSVAFTSILVGLGIDFGIHVVARFEEAAARGAPTPEAVEAALLGSGPGNLAGAVTTSLAFFGVGFSDFLGLSELGIIAGTGVLLCLASALTVLPALLTAFASPGARTTKRPGPAWRPSLRALDRRPGAWVFAGGALAAAGFALAPRVEVDTNLLRLQAEGVEAVDLELRLIGADEGRASAFAVSIVPDLEAAVRRAEAFEALPEVREVESIARIVPPDPAPRRRAAARVGEVLEGLALERGAPVPIDVDGLARRLDKLRFKLRPEKEADWDPARRPEADDLSRVRPLLAEVRERLEALDADVAERRLAPYQARLVEDLFAKLDTLRRETSPLPLTQSDVPPDVRRRLVGDDGRLLLRIHPAENIWEPEARARFIEALRTIDPEVTGIPVQAHESSRLMLRGYVQGGLYSLVVVLVVLLIDLRRLSDVVAALAPLAAGAGWTLGVMAAVDLDFNLANLIILPLMIGIGIDIGIHCVHRSRDDGSAGAALVKSSTGRAVILSGLTTAIGFGSLAIAQHRGIQSLGILLGVGVVANVLAALFVLAPALRLRR